MMTRYCRSWIVLSAAALAVGSNALAQFGPIVRDHRMPVPPPTYRPPVYNPAPVYQPAPVYAPTPVAAPVATSPHGHMTRERCRYPGTAGNQGRQMGIRNAQRIVDAVWSRLGQTCDRLEQFATIIFDTPLSKPMMGGEFAACFYQGYTEEFYARVGDTYDSCQVKCFNEGAQIGKISAEGYCAASIAVGGLDDPGFIAQPPLPICGESLVLGCKSEYVNTASNYALSYGGGAALSCYPFTTGDFENTFENSVRQDCFVPTDVPIHSTPNSSPLASNELF